MERLFGTDGIRGIPGQPPLHHDGIVRVAWAVAAGTVPGVAFNGSEASGPVLLARDSRRSGPKIARSLSEGFALAGCRAIVDLGILPTPALAYLVAQRRAPLGVMISASHNPPEFNGIKFFSSSGEKLQPEWEEAIERKVKASRLPGPGPRTRCQFKRDPRAVLEYLDFLKSTLPAEADFRGLKIVVDCAHGAACSIAPGFLESLGARAYSLGCSPSGRNINLRVGALETGAMRRKVLKVGADCGFSLDGDADRAIFSDETGHILDGDVLLSMAAAYFKEKNLLRRRAVVLTVMSNMGLVRYLEGEGLEVVRVPVGDRNVSAAMQEGGIELGGESSGHLIFRRFSSSGDGLLSALQVLSILRSSGRPLSFYRKRVRFYPQILKNVPVPKKIPFERLPRFSKALRGLQKGMGGDGRLVVRYSGTEPLLRILVEGPDRKQVEHILHQIIESYQKEAGHA